MRRPGLRTRTPTISAERGVGITNLVNVATARADELTRAELRAGVTRLAELVSRERPRVVAVLGLTAYRTAFQRPKASAGRQADDLGPAELWVAPNPSGLNAHETLDSLAASYRRIAEVAGVVSGVVYVRPTVSPGGSTGSAPAAPA